MGSNEKRDLKAEELEKRDAPMVIMNEPQDPVPSDPTTGGGDPAGSEPVAAADQPGNSDGHRNKPWQKSL